MMEKTMRYGTKGLLRFCLNSDIETNGLRLVASVTSFNLLEIINIC